MPPESFLNAPANRDIMVLLPELVLMVGGFVVLMAEMARPKRVMTAGVLSILTLLAALVGLALGPGHLLQRAGGPFLADRNSVQGLILAFQGNLVLDPFALWMKGIVLVGSLFSVLIGIRYAERFRNPGEFFAVLLFATSAASLLANSADLLMIYLAVEFLSISSYIAVGYLKFQPRSTEAAMKYFLYGAITAAVMLYGMSLLYGLTGTTSLYAAGSDESMVTRIAKVLHEAQVGHTGGEGVILIAMVLVTVGLGFKIGMAPFHQWVPDVYDGAPLPVMAWLSVASKAAAMAVFVRVFYTVFTPELWVLPIAALAALTMTVGNLAALPQTNIKRMLAYSSISHAGYTLMAVAALGASLSAETGGFALGATPYAIYGVVVYLATYVFMNLGALAVVTAVYNRIKSHRIDDYAGLSQRAPGLAWAMVFFLLSLAGIPPTAGFWGKFVIFAGTVNPAANPSLVWLAVIGFLNSVVSVYYYWGVVRAMFLMKPPVEEELRSPFELRFAVAIAVVVVLGIFVFVGPFMNLFG